MIYGTTQTHSLGAKAALILGVEFRAIETKGEDKWALRGMRLGEALEEDRVRGKVPFILCEFAWTCAEEGLMSEAVATVGSTSTGAIDDIAEITAVGSYVLPIRGRSLRSLRSGQLPGALHSRRRRMGWRLSRLP